MREPALAVFLLERFSGDETLAGDIIEAYEHGQSRFWLWRQVAAAVLLNLPDGLMPRPRRAGTLPMPVGGIGFIAIVMLITTVAPGAWWLIAAGVLGGFLFAALLIAGGRRRGKMPDGAHHLLLH